ncbi:hypothetical protein Ddye_018213 [Dipteronia dyeriana]|uniref:TTF-type domain-containing protein n=1 Tax=Dipteronia dyeriana TaxID=168575 RepID=A0AAD9UAN4_9ROSI|nr:hypothetical protein Ddye_018213 [Dipteronia dyeriana]
MTGQRKYDSGSQKRKAKERRDMVIQSFTGSMDRYVKRKPNQSEHENVNVNTSLDVNDNAHGLNENEHVDVLNENIDDLNENEHIDELNKNIDDLNDNIEDLNENVDDLNEAYDLCDPGNWKINISQKERDLIVDMGPLRVTNFVYPVENNRSFNDKYYTRSLANGENHDRPWLVYSQLKNKVFYFCCVLFKKGLASLLTSANQGYNDWRNISC